MTNDQDTDPVGLGEAPLEGEEETSGTLTEVTKGFLRNLGASLVSMPRESALRAVLDVERDMPDADGTVKRESAKERLTRELVTYGHGLKIDLPGDAETDIIGYAVDGLVDVAFSWLDSNKDGVLDSSDFGGN